MILRVINYVELFSDWGQHDRGEPNFPFFVEVEITLPLFSYTNPRRIQANWTNIELAKTNIQMAQTGEM